jgi:hypothetical protein
MAKIRYFSLTKPKILGCVFLAIVVILGVWYLFRVQSKMRDGFFTGPANAALCLEARKDTTKSEKTTDAQMKECVQIFEQGINVTEEQRKEWDDMNM